MKYCTNCGELIQDDEKTCSKCGQALETESEEKQPEPVPEATETPEKPVVATKRKLSPKLRLALICGAVILLAAVALVVVLTQGGNGTNLRKMTVISWIEEDGQQKTDINFTIQYDRGLMVEIMGTYWGEPVSVKVTYDFDEHKNPTSVTLDGVVGTSVVQESFKLRNSYDGDKLIRVEVTEGYFNELFGQVQGMIPSVLTNFEGYSEVSIFGSNGEKVQYQNHRQISYSDGYSITTTTYDGDMIAQVEEKRGSPDNLETTVTMFDERGLQTSYHSVSPRYGNVTAYFKYFEMKDTDGQTYLVAGIDYSRSESADADMFKEVLGSRYYLDKNGRVTKIINNSSDEFSITTYDNQGRILSSVYEYKVTENAIRHEETTYEYR